MSLLTHYGFDIREWLQGRDNRSPRVILSMARNLPEGSYLSARLSARHELTLREMKKALSTEDFDALMASQEELDDIDRLTSERMSWTLNNSLTAMLVNLATHAEEAVVGPAAWLDQKGESEQEPSEDGKPGRLQSFFAQIGGSNGA